MAVFQPRPRRSAEMMYVQTLDPCHSCSRTFLSSWYTLLVSAALCCELRYVAGTPPEGRRQRAAT